MWEKRRVRPVSASGAAMVVYAQDSDMACIIDGDEGKNMG